MKEKPQRKNSVMPMFQCNLKIKFFKLSKECLKMPLPFALYFNEEVTFKKIFRFFMAWASVALMISLVNVLSIHSLLQILINCRYNFDFCNFFSNRNCSFSEFHFMYGLLNYVNFRMCKGVYVIKHHFSYLDEYWWYKYQIISVWNMFSG